MTFDLYTAIADDVKEKLESGIADFGLLLEPVEIEQYNFIRMPMKERWCALLRKDSKLASKEVITPKDLEGEKVILSKRRAVKNELENWFGDSYNLIHPAVTSNLSYNNRSILVKNNVGIALCHEFTNLSEDLYLIPLEPEIVNGCVLVWKKNQILSETTKVFLEYVRNAL